MRGALADGLFGLWERVIATGETWSRMARWRRVTAEALWAAYRVTVPRPRA